MSVQQSIQLCPINKLHYEDSVLLVEERCIDQWNCTENVKIDSYKCLTNVRQNKCESNSVEEMAFSTKGAGATGHP